MKYNMFRRDSSIAALAGLVSIFAQPAYAQAPLASPAVISGNTTPPAALQGSAKGLLLGTNSNFQWIQSYGGPLILNSNGGQGGGNLVGIGLTNPTWTLDVAGTIRGTGDGPNFASPGIIGRASSQPGVLGMSTGGNGVYGQGGSAGVVANGIQYGVYAFSAGFAGFFRGNVLVQGNVTYTGALTHTSDSRYKIDVQPLSSALNTIKKMNAVTYQFNRSAFPNMNFPSARQIGFIAQDVQSVLPQLVSKDRDGYLSVDYMQMIPVLVKAIKEQQNTIDDLNQKIQRLNNLEAKLDSLIGYTKMTHHDKANKVRHATTVASVR